jgi:hypothetical protein
MKRVRCFLMLTALTISTHAAASSITPSITGIVSQVNSGSASTQVTIGGHVYTLTAETQQKGTHQTLQPGEVVTLYLAADGHTVIMIQPVVNVPTTP